jgi:hypothetical protein
MKPEEYFHPMAHSTSSEAVKMIKVDGINKVLRLKNPDLIIFLVSILFAIVLNPKLSITVVSECLEKVFLMSSLNAPWPLGGIYG